MSLRSLLFVPCANARAMAKARDIACDALIFDLEDAVGDAEREGALVALAEALQGDFAAPVRLVRIHPQYLNAIHRALKDLRIDGVVVPKTGTPEELRGVAVLWPGVPLWAMIETAAGVVNLGEICGMPGLRGLIAGPNDLRKSLRTRPIVERRDIAVALSQVVLQARAHGLAAIDGVYNAFRDEAGFAAECRQGRNLGFDGKTLIHPGQVAEANRAFSPSDEEVDWAKAVVAAFEGSAAGVVSVNGEMVERLHLDMAMDILRRPACNEARVNSYADASLRSCRLPHNGSRRKRGRKAVDRAVNSGG